MSQAGKIVPYGILTPINSITGNSGGAVPPDGVGNLDFIGAGVVDIVGTPASNLLTVSLAGGTDGQLIIGSTGTDPVFADLTSSGGTISITPGAGTLDIDVSTSSFVMQLDGDAGSATPTLGIITIAGGNNITTASAGSTVTVNVSGTTQYALQVGNATGSLDSLSIGLVNQVLQSGGAGADPAWSTAAYPATSLQGDILYSFGDNLINTLAKDTNATRYLSNTGALNNPAWSQINLTNGVTGTLPVANGGTGAATLTDHGVIVGSGTAALTALAVGTNGQALLGSTGADPTWGQVDLTTTVTGILPVANGGTGTSTFTDHGVLVGSGASSPTALTVGTDGQVLLGSTGADPVFATLVSSGSTISFTPGAGSLNLETAGTIAGSFPTDSGTATPAVGALTVSGGTNINTSGAAAAVTVNLDAALTSTTSHDFAAGGRIGTATGAGNTLLLQAYDVDGAAYTTFATLTANNTPTMDLDDAVTKAGQYIYRASGTDVAVADGGTGASSLTDHGVLVGSGTAAITALAVGTNGQVLLGSTGADPVFATLASSGSTIAFTPGAGTLNLETGSTVAVSVTTDAGSAVPSAGVLTVVGGVGCTTSGAGSTVTINASSSGFPFIEATGATQTISVNTGYITNNGAQLVYTLPATAAVGDRVAVVGNSANGWRIDQNAGQTVHYISLDTTTGAGGSLTSTNRYDCIELVCVTANTDFVARSSCGNINVI